MPYEIKISKAERVVSVDFDALTAEVKVYIVQYGLTQILNDAASSVPASKPAEAWALSSKKLAALLAGEVRTRREGASELEKEMIAIALHFVKLSKAFKDSPAKDQMEAARKYAPNYRAQAEKIIAIRHATDAAAENVELPELAIETGNSPTG